MSRRELADTTSRAALIIGMTNTDQVGMWQARSPVAVRQPEAEVLPDAGDGAGSGGDDDGEARNELGLTEAEQAEFDAMRTGDPAPDAEGAEEPEQEGDSDPADGTSEPADGEQPDGREPTAGEKVAEPGQRPPKTVNYQKYQRELKKVNEALAAERTEKQKLRDDGIKLAERVKMIDEALRAPPPQQQQAPPEPVKNPFEEEDIDPDVNFKEAVAQVNRRVKFQNENQQQFNQTVQVSSEDRDMKETFERDFRNFAVSEPAIIPAYQYLKDARLTQICLAEFDKDPNDPTEQFTPQEVQRMVEVFNNEEKWLVGNAIKKGKSPAQAILKMAKTFGFKAEPPQAAPLASGKAPAAPAARAAAPARQAAPQGDPDATQRLAELRRNRDDGRSLSDGGGAPPEGLSVEMILRLDDDAFAEMVDSMSPHQLNTLMGRVPS